MFDPRDDARDRGEDIREHAYEGRDQTGDPRDVFLHDVDLPLEREREYVLDRDQVYELDGDDSRTLATVGAFRVVPERDLLDGDDEQCISDSLDHPRVRRTRSAARSGPLGAGVTRTTPAVPTTVLSRRNRVRRKRLCSNRP
jgi:hypothetical protein